MNTLSIRWGKYSEILECLCLLYFLVVRRFVQDDEFFLIAAVLIMLIKLACFYLEGEKVVWIHV